VTLAKEVAATRCDRPGELKATELAGRVRKLSGMAVACSSSLAIAADLYKFRALDKLKAVVTSAGG
jgi:hypothetical protein